MSLKELYEEIQQKIMKSYGLQSKEQLQKLYYTVLIHMLYFYSIYRGMQGHWLGGFLAFSFAVWYTAKLIREGWL